MRKVKYLSSVFIILVTSAFAVTNALNFQHRVSNQQPSPDFSNFPIVDFYSNEPNGPKTERLNKNKKFNSRYGKGISETSQQIFTIMDWEIGLPAFPIARSSSVVIGKISSATAFLSEDRTRIYSEFEIKISAVLKQDDRVKIEDGQVVTVGRGGGRVRLPSGKIVVSWINNQNMPRVGGKYVLFLTHEYPQAGDAGNEFYIVTGYELRNGKVAALDDLPLGHPVTAYYGKDETVLLSDLFSSLGGFPTKAGN